VLLLLRTLKILGVAALLLKLGNDFRDRVLLKKKVVLKDGDKFMEFDACSVTLLLNDEEIQTLNSPHSTDAQKAETLLTGQKRTRANPEWREYLKG
jgi:hypothetical protein